MPLGAAPARGAPRCGPSARSRGPPRWGRWSNAASLLVRTDPGASAVQPRGPDTHLRGTEGASPQRRPPMGTAPPRGRPLPCSWRCRYACSFFTKNRNPDPKVTKYWPLLWNLVKGLPEFFLLPHFLHSVLCSDNVPKKIRWCLSLWSPFPLWTLTAVAPWPPPGGIRFQVERGCPHLVWPCSLHPPSCILTPRGHICNLHRSLPSITLRGPNLTLQFLQNSH